MIACKNESYKLFIEEIQRLYAINNEDKAYKYFKLRYLIFNLDKNKNEIDTIFNQASFLLSELPRRLKNREIVDIHIDYKQR